MPFIQRHNIDITIRGQHDEAHKRQLRQALLNPGLTEEQHKHLRNQIDCVGQPKQYDAKAPPKVGAVALDPNASPPPSKQDQERKRLGSLKKPELVQMARDQNISTRGTKSDIIDRLIGQ